jgi:pyruvate/2-oxoglutarate/acetoin dehydrogenase E1 component
MAKRVITFVEAIREATDQSMRHDDNVIVFGLGVDDPKNIFGSTKGLQKKYGKSRVFDVPTSENALTGIGIGASLYNKKPIMIHQRLDFFLLAMDQLVNAAAKWYFMFGKQKSVPITIRLIMGRGWGQGPTHSQNLQAWFAHIPGLKVVMPATAADAKGLLISSIQDKNPVLFLEHRWLHNLKGTVSREYKPIPLGKANILREGKDISIIAMSYMVIEAIHASEFLSRNGISCEIVDLRTVSPIDYKTIFHSIKKTKNVIVLDTGTLDGSISGEIVSKIIDKCWSDLSSKPERMAMPNVPEGTSFALTKDYHVTSKDIAMKISSMLKKKVRLGNFFNKKYPHDVPGDWFSGPF